MARILVVANPNSPLTKARSIVGKINGHTIYWLSQVDIPDVISDAPATVWPIFSTAREILMISKMIQSHKPDIIHVHYARQGLRTPILLANRIPMIVSTMGGDILPEQGYNGIHTLLIRQMLNHATYITSKSPYLDSAINQIGNYQSKIRRVTWGIDLKRFRLGIDVAYLRQRWQIPMNDLIFLDVRGAKPLYNKNIILKAFAQYIHAGNPSATLLISEFAGDATYLAMLRELANELNVADQVRFIGSIPYEKMPDYLTLADVVISIPSSDGLPQSIYESLACGTFLILGNLPQYKGVVEEAVTAKFVSVTDSVDVAEALCWVAQNKDVRQQVCHIGRAYVENAADSQKEAALVNQLYAELLNR